MTERPFVVDTYTFDLQVRKDLTSDIVAVGTWDTQELLTDTHDSKSLQLGGFLATGGHKIVITATDKSHEQKLALSWPKFNKDKGYNETFINDIAIHKIIKSHDGPSKSWCLLFLGTTQLADRNVAVTELMDATLLGGIHQWGSQISGQNWIAHKVCRVFV
jgi:hypothetical protein